MKKPIIYNAVIIDQENNSGNNDELKEKYNNHNVNYIKDVGCDMYVPKNVTVPGNAISFKIGLGIKVRGYIDEKSSSYMIFPRSSMGAKTPLRLCNSIGLVDPGYTGELFIFVDNSSSEPYEIKKFDRLVQLVGPGHEEPKIKLVETLEESERNENGIGSSGR